MHIPSRIGVTAVVLVAVAVPVGIGVALDTTQDQSPEATACEAPAFDELVRAEPSVGR